MYRRSSRRLWLLILMVVAGIIGCGDRSPPSADVEREAERILTEPTGDLLTAAIDTRVPSDSEVRATALFWAAAIVSDHEGEISPILLNWDARRYFLQLVRAYPSLRESASAELDVVAAPLISDPVMCGDNCRPSFEPVADRIADRWDELYDTARLIADRVAPAPSSDLEAEESVDVETARSFLSRVRDIAATGAVIARVLGAGVAASDLAAVAGVIGAARIVGGVLRGLAMMTSSYRECIARRSSLACTDAGAVCGALGQPCCAGDECNPVVGLLCESGRCVDVIGDAGPVRDSGPTTSDAGMCDIRGSWWVVNTNSKGAPGESGPCRYQVDVLHVDLAGAGCTSRLEGSSCVLEDCPPYLGSVQLSPDGSTISAPSTIGSYCIGNPMTEQGDGGRCLVDIRSAVPHAGTWTGSAWAPEPYTLENGCTLPTFAPSVVVPNIALDNWITLFDVPGLGCGPTREAGAQVNGMRMTAPATDWPFAACGLSLGCPGLTSGPPYASVVFTGRGTAVLRIEMPYGCAFRSDVAAPEM